MTTQKFIDIDRVLINKNKALYKLLPRFVINYLKRITHQDDINAFIEDNRLFYDYDFAKKTLDFFEVHVEIVGGTHLQEVKRPIIASNHPLGGLDGIALLADIGRVFPAKALVNDILMHIENLKNLFIPVNKHGKNVKSYIMMLNEAFNSDDAIVLFPAGLVSRKQKGVIKDLEWKKTVIQRARKHKRDIVPTFVNGRNSDFFYSLANWRKFLGMKTNIEMLFLVDEMHKHRKGRFVITYGTPIPYETFDNRMTDEAWAEALKNHVYQLALDCNAHFGY